MNKTYRYSKLVSPTELHVYNIVVADGHPLGGWYCQLTSIDGFRNRMSKRWYDKYRREGLTIIQDYDGHGYPPGKVPFKVIEHHFTSVWGFYAWIGFDYKDKTVGQLDKLIVNWRTK